MQLDDLKPDGAALQLDARLFAFLMESSIDAIVTESLGGIIQSWNPAAEQMFGYAAEQAVGSPVSLFIPNESVEEEHRKIACLQAGKPMDGYDTVRVHSNGQHLAVSVTRFLIDVSQGQALVVSRIVRHVSDRKEDAQGQAHGSMPNQAELERRRLADVFRQAPAFICVLRGPNHVFEMANDRYLQLVGQRELIGRSVREALPDIEGQGFFELLDKVYATGQPITGSEVPVQLVRRPGRTPEERYLDLVYQPLRDAAEVVNGVVAVGVDVTDRRQAEGAVREREAQYRALFDSMDEGYCVVEMIFDDGGAAIDYRFLEINPAFEKHTGISGAQGRTMREFVPDLESHWFETYGRVVRTGESVRFTEKSKAMDERWFDVYAFRFGAAGINKVAILFNDITTRQRAEDTVRASEERFRSLVTATSQIVWTTAADGLAVEDSPTWRAFTGQTTQQWLGRGWLNAIHPDDWETTSAAWRQALASNSSYDIEYRLRRHDGAFRWTMARAVPVLDDAGVVREWVGMNTDISDRKQAEQALRDSEERFRKIAADLSEADRRKDEFLATLAHELRNPLAPIRNGLQLIKLADGQTLQIEKAQSMMERQLTQMVRLVDDLMDVSRISLGKLELRRERLDVASILNSAVETSRPLIEQMGQSLIVTMPERALMIDADMTRMAQVFMNLLNNAAKYGNRGGKIGLKVERLGDFVVTTVSDTGIGIDADQLPKIFAMFTQLGGALDRSQGGLGIGLTLVKRLVEMHGGSVEAKSAGLGLGSQFIVRLPIMNDALPVPALGITDGAAVTKPSLRILIVDDNRDGADSLSELLTLVGNDTRTAYDGQQGVDLAGEYRPDVILLDIGLPKLNGYEACRLIRKQLNGDAVMLIAVTGWGQDDDRQRSLEAGFDHHLVKPVDPQALMLMLAGIDARP